MEKLVQELLQYARATWYKRWWILPIAWVVCLAGWVWVQSLPDVYEADSRVYVDTQSVLDPLMRGMTVRPDTQQRLRMVTQTMFSRDNLERIARESDLDILTGESDLDDQIAMLRDGVRLNSGRDDNIFTVSFRHRNPDVAHGVVRTTVNLFMERGLGGARLDLTTSRQFIERQIENYERQLAQKEAEIEEFKRNNVAYLTSGGDFYSRLERAREQLEQARVERREAQEHVRTFAERLAEAEASGFAMDGYENPHLDRRIEALESELDSLRQRYTSQHPDVQAQQRILNQLRQRRQNEASEFASSPASLQIGGNPQLDALRNTLAWAESRVASLDARIDEFQRRVQRLEADLDRVPAVESEHAALTRNYEVLRNSYRELQNRRERAVMSGEVEAQTDAIDFRVLEPPARPRAPAFPDRPLLASGVLLLGLAAGIAFAFLMSQLRSTIHDGRQLADVTGRPVLGHVSRVNTPQRRRRRASELTVFAVTIGLLLLVYAVLMALYLTGMEGILDRLAALLPSRPFL